MKAFKLSGNIYEVVKVVCGDAFWDLRVILTPKRLKGQYLTDNGLWAIVEEQCAQLSDEMWREIARIDRREYDRGRETRPRGLNSHKGANSKSGRRINDRPRGGHFVAVDSEGFTVRQYIEGKDREKIEYFDQRTFLWMAGGAEGFKNQAMAIESSALNLEGFNSEQIFEFLLSLPSKFADREPSGKQPVFISFGFNYDIGQIVKDFSYEKAWQVRNAKPWSKRNDRNYHADRNQPILWKQYAIRCVSGKSVTLYRLRDPDKPFKYSFKDGKRKRRLDASDRIEIFDTFGFFQMSLVAAIENCPGVVTPDELKIIKAGKKQRGNFKLEDVETAKVYTALELKSLASMMNVQRASLLNAIPDKPIKLKRWHGAGSIAKAMLDFYIGGEKTGEERRAHIRQMLGSEMFQGAPNTKPPDERERMDWIFRAYFGGRVDLVKQGNYHGVIHEYDLSSAYPSFAVVLPNMKNGCWEKVINPTREQVESANMVSMFHVRTHGYERDLPFYALPFRTESGSVYYPPLVEGIYMRDHVIAAYKHYDYFQGQKRLCHYGVNPHGPSLEIVSAWLFHPATDEKPFAWIRGLFDYRVQLEDKAGKQVIKLGINSVYGKFAESIGDRPPLYASPFFAAAITAGAQRKTVEAALTAPDDIVMFATDAVYATRPLDVHAPEKKTLGEWEHTAVGAGGVFIQSGVYLLRYKSLKETYINRADEDGHFKCKTRGFSPKEIDRAGEKSFNQVVSEVLGRDIPQYWERGEPVYEFVYSNYLALGISAVSPYSWKRIGQWKKKLRSLKLDATEGKRVLDRGTNKHSIEKRKSRAHKLVNLRANDFFPDNDRMSARKPPKWLAHWEESEDAAEEAENVSAGLT